MTTTLRDATPGQAFRDRDGDVWVRTEDGAVPTVVCAADSDSKDAFWRVGDMARAEDWYGPFTPLGPKP